MNNNIKTLQPKFSSRLPLSVFLAFGLLTTTAFGNESDNASNTQLFWGDTHLHTSYSFDAYLNQNDSADPDTAYRWAKGLPVVHPYHNAKVKIKQPLDFLVVSDHAEALGVLRTVNEDLGTLPELDWWPSVKRWFAIELIQLSFRWDFSKNLFMDMLPEKQYLPGTDPTKDPGNTPINSTLGDVSPIVKHSWQQIIEAAERHNQPGKFTALLGWEWSSIPAGSNLHRVVMSPNGKAEAEQYLPFSAIDSQYPEDLWRWLSKTSKQTNSQFIAIPHNSNISKGYMFGEQTVAGKPITMPYIKTRMEWEPVVEITQIKGDSETHPKLSPDDEFANFEPFEYYLQREPQPYQAKPGDYIRSGLKRGLELDRKLGANPYQFGVIGSTDSHSGLSSAEEENFWGKMAFDSIPANKSVGLMSKNGVSGWDMSVAGLAAVWAESNTRQDIFDAFKRREVYATTGPRIQLRLFAGWAFKDGDQTQANMVRLGYAKGVPMGGELSKAPAKTPIKLMIHAAKDPKGVGLDRVQVIKAWLDDQGQSHEQVFNVAWAGDRQLDAQGKLAAIANTVELSSGRQVSEQATELGADQLSVVWQDPSFNPDRRALYYVRVLQTPTARHSLLDAIALKTTPEDKYPLTLQERAYSSAIWYTP